MGSSQRRKGHDFERFVATAYRAKWPEATVRRSLQAHQPYEPDVLVEHPELTHVTALWTECQHAKDPTPLGKLHQAERDCEAARSAGRYPALIAGARHPWLPVAVWRKSGGATIQATMRSWVWVTLTLGPRAASHVDQVVITVDFRDFVSAVRGA